MSGSSSPLFASIRLAIGWGLGSIPGIGLMLSGQEDQGLGLAIMLGTLGLILALASELYQTTSSATLLRGILMFCRLTAAKNLPLSENLLPLPVEMNSRRPQSADIDLLDNRMYVGLRVGWVAAIAPAIWLAVNIANHNAEPDPWVIDVAKRAVIGFFFTAIVGGVCGMGIAGLTVPGVHQRNILLGPLLGGALGIGFGTAVSTNAVDPRLMFWVCVGAFAFFGLIGGVLSSDNFQRILNRSDDGSKDQQFHE